MKQSHSPGWVWLLLALGVLVAGLASFWNAKDPGATQRTPAAHSPPTAPLAVAIPEVGALPTSAQLDPPHGEEPGGFCGGPPGPDGYRAPGAMQAVADVVAGEQAEGGHAAALAWVRQALATPDAAESETLVGRARAVAPTLVSAQALEGLLRLYGGRPFSALGPLAAAVEAQPARTAWWRRLAEAYADTGHAAAAVALMGRYVAAEPDDWAAARRGRLMRVQQDVEQGFVTVSDPLFPTLADPGVPAPRVAALLDALHDATGRIAAVVGPVEEPVGVAVYAERADLLASTCAQGWAHALYDGRMRFQDEAGGALRVPALRQRVVTHELAHVVYRRLGGRRDGWLVEGVARHAAGEEDDAYRGHLAMMARTGAYIPLPSMMGPMMELTDAADSALAYDQALAMVHFVLSTSGAQGLAVLLADRQTANGVEALARATGNTAASVGPAFLAFVQAQTGVSPP